MRSAGLVFPLRCLYISHLQNPANCQEAAARPLYKLEEMGGAYSARQFVEGREGGRGMIIVFKGREIVSHHQSGDSSPLEKTNQSFTREKI